MSIRDEKEIDDSFDFSEEIFGEPSSIDTPTTKEPIGLEEVETSYVLVKVLIDLLIEKGKLNYDEVPFLMDELHHKVSEYMRGEGQ